MESMNDTYNSILIDEKDYNTLRDSIDSFHRYNPKIGEASRPRIPPTRCASIQGLDVSNGLGVRLLTRM